MFARLLQYLASLGGKTVGISILAAMLLLTACGSSGGPSVAPSSPQPLTPAPAVSSVNPSTGPTTGGTITTIKGSDFQSGATVAFGGVPATSVTFNSSTQLTATSPKGNAGTVDVVVTNPDAQTGTLPNAFTYSDPASGGSSGGGLSGSPGATATQYILTYTASTNKVCTIEVSQNQSFAPLVHAVDPSIFQGSDEDGQTNIGRRTFVVGERAIAAETDTAPSIAVPSGAAVRAPLKYDGYTTGAVTVAYSGQPFVAGDDIIVSGMSDSSFDSTWARVMSASTNSFTYWTPTTAAGSSGGGTITRSDHFSLALENNSTYYYRIGGPNNTCGATPSTGTFTTMNWPNGDTFAEGFPTSPNGAPITPTVFETHVASKNSIIDPITGTLLRPLTLFSDDNTDVGDSFSGGQHHCSLQTDSNSYYHCYMPLGNSGAAGLWAISPSAGATVFLGQLGFNANSVCSNSVTYTHIDPTTNSLWDSGDPNTLYGVCGDASNSAWLDLFKVTYTGNDAAASPGSYITTASGPQMVIQNLSAALSSFDASYNSSLYSRWKPWAVEGHYIWLTAFRWNQNSPAWLTVVDLNTGSFIAATSGWSNGESATCNLATNSCTNFPPCRWCGTHGQPGIGGGAQGWTAQGIGGFASGQQTMGSFDETLNQTGGLNATDKQDTITVTSTIVGSYGTTGDPASEDVPPDGSNFLDIARPGDVFKFSDTGEMVMVLARNSATSLVIARGCHQGSNYWPVCDGTGETTHADGAKMWALCWGYNNSGIEEEWNFANDPHGQDTTNTWAILDHFFFGGHGSALIPWGVVEAWSIKSSNTWDSAFMHQIAQYQITPNPTFDGKTSNCFSANCTSYPHYFPSSPSATPWFWDTQNYTGAGTPDSSALVAGTSHIYKYTFSTTAYQVHTFHSDLPYFSVAGVRNLANISAPGAMLTDTTADNWKFCVAYQAGECWAGSSAGDVYANLNFPSGNPSTLACNYGDAGIPSSPDWCVDNTKPGGNGLLQVGLAPANQLGTNGNNGNPVYGWGKSRKLLQGLFGPPRHVFAHAQDLPDQRYAYFGQVCLSGPYFESFVGGFPGCASQTYLVKIPPQPPDDGINRTTYENVPIAVGAGSNGATHARVKYGYQEDGPVNNFYCTQYRKTCYYSDQNLPLNGTVNLAVGVPQRVIFYQVEYLDSSDNVVATGPITAYAVP